METRGAMVVVVIIHRERRAATAGIIAIAETAVEIILVGVAEECSQLD
ncbi:hypothetical protein Xmau_03983 [Xenorhabdus mauleonii]|uniref:Uncharacterized protein n=1 Tax=Xenorhabdus mauleonii TaxID=351675 RepID=A0A1I3TJD1_9GAMM|nr:hypothetical protein [Xenorhabdus mauleonii]PHM37059.1 hypothetical protein Xmau_03983 [Xenorhabdus mauleonii]SFJ71278.1 hypothetical protein SAMN05421680_11467 [Xenorhabdus mauleonii]